MFASLRFVDKGVLKGTEPVLKYARFDQDMKYRYIADENRRK
jgi:hypothetical protein